jgi:predicted N-formylglutamate amidohydrolase
LLATDFFLISCEHGGNRIPPRYRDCFREHEELLQTHRAFDRGALQLARDMSRSLLAPLFAATVSRLLVDLNRSPGHRQLFSEATRNLPLGMREEIIKHYYLPYRDSIEACIRTKNQSGARIIHVSCHSFTTELNGKVRDADIGLLYDPARRAEAALCKRWQAALNARAPEFRTRLNYPYRGIADGLVTHFRRQFNADRYLGIELEINQRHADQHHANWRSLRKAVIEALREAAR